jgi:uncharacterized protein (TIGR00299 family) protein
MILGALVALGIDRIVLETEIGKLALPSIDTQVNTVDRAGIAATHVEVNTPDQKAHRHLSEITQIIQSSDLSVYVKELALRIFTRLAEAEAGVHGIPVEKVHFHEVGALDAIVDVVGACTGFEHLGIERFICSKIHVGSGIVGMEHGKFPVPPPAVAELLRNVPIYSTDLKGELITPTAAAIITTVCESYGNLPNLKVEKIGYGAGSRSYDDFPNVLRLMVGETAEVSIDDKPVVDELVLLETNLDDISPQVLGYVMEQAFELGALDVWFTPIQMKKNRPATMISVLCAKEKREVLSDLLYAETTTLGLRVRTVQRECLKREVVKVDTRFGTLEVKVARYNGRVSNVMPEYEQLKEFAEKYDLPLKVIEREVWAELEKKRLAAAAID